jgi:hypothetical protein
MSTISKPRTVLKINKSVYVALPPEFGFHKGDLAICEQIDEVTVKVTKVEYNKAQIKKIEPLIMVDGKPYQEPKKDEIFDLGNGGTDAK